MEKDKICRSYSYRENLKTCYHIMSNKKKVKKRVACSGRNKLFQAESTPYPIKILSSPVTMPFSKNMIFCIMCAVFSIWCAMFCILLALQYMLCLGPRQVLQGASM